MSDINARITSLLDRGIHQMTILLRHAERNADIQSSQDEPFVPLTEKGKQDAYEFGLLLPPGLRYRFFSSIRPRCIEKAYQIEKGCIEQGSVTTVNKTVSVLVPSFFVDYDKATTFYADGGPAYFYQRWLKGQLPADVILPPEPEAYRLTSWLSDGLGAVDYPCINMAVTHDSHLYLLRHLGLRREPDDFSMIGYLQGIIVFQGQGNLFGIDEQETPVAFV